VPSDNLINLIGLEVDTTGPNGIVVPCWNLNRGINTGSRAGGAKFRLDSTIVYSANGALKTEKKSLKISDTTEIGDFDGRSVVIQGKFDLTAKPDNGSNVTITTQIFHGDPPLTDDPAGEPASATFPVK